MRDERRTLAKESAAQLMLTKAFSEAMTGGQGSIGAKQALKNLRHAVAADLELRTAVAHVISVDPKLRGFYDALVAAAGGDIDFIPGDVADDSSV